MVVVVKYFHEKDATEFNELIRTHDERIIFLHHHLSLNTQLRLIINDLGIFNFIILIFILNSKIDNVIYFDFREKEFS